MELTEWAKIQEGLLKAQLSVIRGYVRDGDVGGKERNTSPNQRKSQMSMITDILVSGGAPLHVSEIIRRVEQHYGIKLDRESMVSALTKKVRVRFSRATQLKSQKRLFMQKASWLPEANPWTLPAR